MASDGPGNREAPSVAPDAFTQVPARVPLFVGASVSSGSVVNVEFNELMPGWSSVLERATRLETDGWQPVGGFSVTGRSMSWSETVTNTWTNLFYRLRSRDVGP